ncbi:MAG: type II CRISPR RNA-guided endonuclease Cas9 [Opitutales bacterium]|nr:type II CRISPR RNA-guided endonuclease Cas9 [Opitutales bacterium]
MKTTKVFAFDLGANSIGWCVVLLGEDGLPVEIIDAGVRIFDNSRDPKTNTPLSVEKRIISGASTRRDRQLMRTRYLCKLLKEFGLLSDKNPRSEVSRNPYKLRSLGATKKLDLYGLGRTILHINKRRGFKSNRKADKKSDEKESQGIKAGISKLREQLVNKTLGQFLYERQKSGDGTRMRAKIIKNKNDYEIYADREMYENEFWQIWHTQQKFYPSLTDEKGQKIFDTLFFQRPLKTPELGWCQFEDERRAYKAYPISQRFRIYQEVNALEIVDISDNNNRLTVEDRQKLIKALLENDPKIVDKKGKATFAKIKKFLNIKNFSFNFESEKRKDFASDLTAFVLASPDNFGEKWRTLDDSICEEIIDAIIQNEENVFIKLVEKYFGFDSNKAKSILDDAIINLPEGTTNLSTKAMQKIMPYFESGMRYDLACKAAGYNFNANYQGEIFDTLPYYGQILRKLALGGDKQKYSPEENPEKYYGKINNPTVHVALNQLRKVVNKLISVYGKPDRIAIETARDLPLGVKGLSELKKEQNKNQTKNEEIAEELKKLGVANNARNRMKYKLWEDLNPDFIKRMCPFCGRQIERTQLFESDFEIEHLLPFSDTFDDSRANKVISCRSCNRIKAKRPPHEAFFNRTGYDWDEILARVSALPKSKQWRFKADAMEQFKEKYGDFIARMLNDTRYMSKVSREYFTAIIPTENIITLTGSTTAMLRGTWGLNSILEPDHNVPETPAEAEQNSQSDNSDKDKSESAPKKNRADHRHHAVDAFVISTVGRKLISIISQCAKRNEQALLENILKSMPSPFTHIPFDVLKEKILNINVSHKLDRGDVKGAIKQGKTVASLHKDTAYGRIGGNDTDEKITLVKRVPLDSIELKEDKIEEIANLKIRNDLLNIFHEIHSTPTTEKAKQNEWLSRLQQYAQENKVRRLRIHIANREIKKLIPIKDKKSGKVYKYMDNAESYCIDIYKPSNSDKWQFEVINMFEAHKNEMPQWRKNDSHAKLVMRLFKRDTIAYEENGEYKVAVITNIATHGQLGMLGLMQANVEGNHPKKMPGALQKLNARKVYVDEIGRIFDPKRNS